jgi:hypothetical protein
MSPPEPGCFKEMDLSRLADSYFYEIGLLCEAYFARAF